jgi:DNA-binding FadR family transcriptional regulator
MSADSPGSLPPSLRAFVHSCIDSIGQIELVVMLRGSDRLRTVRDVASELGVSQPVARRDLETLAARGLLEVKVGEETSYRYQPKSADLARYCDELAQYYITSRQALLGFVATESRLSIKRFADAFRLRDINSGGEPDPEK